MPCSVDLTPGALCSDGQCRCVCATPAPVPEGDGLSTERPSTHARLDGVHSGREHRQQLRLATGVLPRHLRHAHEDAPRSAERAPHRRNPVPAAREKADAGNETAYGGMRGTTPAAPKALGTRWATGILG